MHAYYRISDNSYDKPKLPGADKWFCLRDFQSKFSRDSVKIEYIADNCKVGIRHLIGSARTIHYTSLGNAGSLRYALQLAMQLPANEVVYFCEDDYLHKWGSVDMIEEIQDKTDYFTLYDHPDKYTEDYQFGEVSKVLRTRSSHWRFSQSTTMTFGCKVRTLQEDWTVWEKFTEGTHPHDHFIFTELKQKGRLLAVAIPGAACHTDLTFSNVKGENTMETWAIQRAVERITLQVTPGMPESVFWEDHKSKEDLWNELMMLNLRLQQRDLNNPIRNSKAGD